MSRSLILKTLSMVSMGLGVGAGVAAALQTPATTLQADRKIASLESKSKKTPLMLGKHLSTVQVALQAPAGIADSEGQSTELVGYIRLNQPVDSELRYRFELPEGVRVIEGRAEDAWPSAIPGETVEVRLVVSGFSKEDLKLVALHGFVRDGDTVLGNSAVLTSRPEDSYEMLAVASGIAAKAATAAPVEKPTLTGRILR